LPLPTLVYSDLYILGAVITDFEPGAEK